MTLYSNTPRSVTFLSSNIEKSYFQAGHFIGESTIIEQMSKWIEHNLSIDIKNNVFTKWHDETYFNFYLYKINPSIINVIRGDIYLSGIENIGSIQALNKEKLFNKLQSYDTIIDKIIYNIKNNLKLLHTNSCLIIGSNPSLLSKKIGEKIDKSFDVIVRLNRMPDISYKDYYGMNTTFFIGCYGTLKNVPNKIIIDDDTIKKISINFIPIKDKWLHTGFISILILLKMFKLVKIFGFGYDNVQENENDTKFIHGTIDKSKINHHIINFEHSLIDKMVKDKKIFRMENYYNE